MSGEAVTISTSNYWPGCDGQVKPDLCISGELRVEYDAVNDRYTIGIVVTRDNHQFAAYAVLDGAEWPNYEVQWTCAIWSVVWQKMLKNGYSE